MSWTQIWASVRILKKRWRMGEGFWCELDCFQNGMTVILRKVTFYKWFLASLETRM